MFSIIKPDAVSAGNAVEILAMIEKAGFKVLGLRMTRLSERQAQGFYAVHQARPFFGGLVKFMTEGPIVVMALEREDAVKGLREVMGATNPANAAEGTVRKRGSRPISSATASTDRTRRRRPSRNYGSSSLQQSFCRAG